MGNYIVYVRTDEKNRIIEINSSAFLTDTTGWTQIDEGAGDKYHHAQGNYFSQPIYTADGIPRYALADGAPVLRSEEEIEADRAEIIPVPSREQVLAQQVADLQNQILTMRLGGY